MAVLSSKEVDATVVRFLNQWRKTTRPLTSIDVDTFCKFFYFLDILITVHDQDKKPVLITVNREHAIKATCRHYDMKLGKDLDVPSVYRDS